MFRKFFAPALLLMLAVAVVALLVVGICRSVIAAAKEEEKVCGTVVGLQGRVTENLLQATVGNDNHAVLVPTRQAYSRLVVGKEFTLIYRQGELIAIGDGNLCKK